MPIGCHTGKRDTRGGTAGLEVEAGERTCNTKAGGGSRVCTMYKDTEGQGTRRVRKANKNYVRKCHNECFVC